MTFCEYLIYGLIDPLTKQLRYIGRSSEWREKISKSKLGRSRPDMSDRSLVPGYSGKPITRNDGKIFKCVRTAAEHLEVSRSSIINVMKGRKNQIKGFRFKYLTPETKNYIEKVEVFRRSGRIIRSDGVIFESVEDCSYKMKVSKTNIRRALCKMRPHCKGFTFSYLIPGGNNGK